MSQNPARERDDVFKIQQDREGGIQNPATQREKEIFKIQQDVEWY